jgi:hypothetical protein
MAWAVFQLASEDRDKHRSVRCYFTTSGDALSFLCLWVLLNWI